MTVQEYTRHVARHLKCSRLKKREIKKQLQSHIEIALGEGRELGEILEEMGKPEDLAEDFNENLSGDWKKRGKMLWMVLAGVLAVLAVGAGWLYWILPKGYEITENSVFDQEELRVRAEEVVHLVTARDQEGLNACLSQEMREVMEEMTIDDIRGYIGEDWGELHAIGNAYMSEIVQKGEHMAVVQLNASYDNVSVTFTLMFDTKLELYGLYVK